MDEEIVFVNLDGSPTGQTGPKLASHTADTKLHLAFSCYIFNEKTKKFLFTQRALVKKVWPGVWTNSVCGHPMPGETIEEAIKRRSKYELGLNNLKNITCIKKKYLYKTPPFKGIIENEFCPIYTAFTAEEPLPNPMEVEAYKWVDISEYESLIKKKDPSLSYWAIDQFPKIKKTLYLLIANK